MRLVPTLVSLALAGCVETNPDGEIDAAKTPDGLPPSVETVCDDYTGAAYGLCTAYCEAMDCDHDPHHASDKACQQVAANFEKKTGDILPCEAPVGCVDAVDDVFTDANRESTTLPVLDNDCFDSEVTSLEFLSPDGLVMEFPADVVTATGTASLLIDPAQPDLIFMRFNGEGGQFTVEFDYQACSVDGCDAATVTVTGS